MKTAVMVVAYNRPHYLSRVLNSLERNPESVELPFWFFLDAGDDKRNKEVRLLVDKCSIKNKNIVVRKKNLGTGRNLIGGRRKLFEGEGYDRVILFEDDMVVNPQYIGLTMRLSDEYHRYKNVGTIQAHARDLRSKADQEQDIFKLCLTRQHFWGYCLTKEVWEAICPYLYEYEKKFLSGIGKYSGRDHRGIREWMKKKLKTAHKTPTGTTLDIAKGFTKPAFTRIGSRTATGQDAVTNIALQLEGLHRVTTIIPRTKYIGEHGEHSNSSVFKSQGWDESKTFEWTADEHPHDFKFVWEK